MKSKFKFGDRVKIIVSVETNVKRQLLYDVGTIIKVYDNCVYEIKITEDGCDYFVLMNEYELDKINVPEYITIGTSIDCWMKNPEYKLEEKFNKTEITKDFCIKNNIPFNILSKKD